MNIADLLNSGSIHFAWPWMFALLPLPWLLRIFTPASSENIEAALKVPYLEDFEHSGGHSNRRSRLALTLYTLAWIMLILATARPQHVGEAVELPVSGRDLMLAIDLSGSMKTADFSIGGRVINRLQATKLVASDFIERRVGDRIGLILFGEQAYLQSPLTFDRVTVNTFLDEAALGLAGRATAIGDAIGLALKRLRSNDEQSGTESTDRILILMTDGDNTAGIIQPEKAAELAQREGMKIYTIGIGSNLGMNVMNSMLSLNNYSELDETTLKHVAEITGGQYFRAHNTRELAGIYQELDKLEPVERDTQSYRPTTALFYWPLSAALCFTALLLLRQWWRR